MRRWLALPRNLGLMLAGLGIGIGGSSCLDWLRLLRVRPPMMISTRKPATVGDTLVEEFMRPMGLT